jgi:acetolactate synthase-1/2/3 large subunit
MKVGDRLAQLLVEYGVDYVFGVPGGQTLPLYVGIMRSGGRIAHVLMRDERSAGFAADAWARFTGRTGVCDATVGPGATNLLSPLGEAYSSSIPLVAIISDIPRVWEHRRVRGNASQGLRQLEMFQSVSKWQTSLAEPSAVDDVVDAAFRVARTGRPGPVVVAVPEDVANAEVRDSAVSARARTGAVPAHRPAPDPDMLQRAVVLVRGARRPALLVGGGAVASGAFAEVRALAACLDAPVATSITGKGIVAETEARACGVAGSMGNPIANQVLKSADLVVFIGTKAGQVATFGYEAFGSGVPAIHLDIDPEEMGRNFPDSLPLVADVRSGLAALLAALADHHAKTDWDHADIARRLSAWQQAEATALRRPGEPLHPAAVVEAVNVAATEDDVVVSDASLASGWMAVFYRARRAARQYLSPRGLAGLGWGAPAAVGAALACGGKRRVLLFAGDGGFAYSVQELEVMARLRLPVVAVILNNDTLAWVKHVEKKRIAEGFISTDFNHVDFAMVARGFGARGYQARTVEELAAALERERVPDGPALIDVATDQWATPVLRFSSTGE